MSYYISWAIIVLQVYARIQTKSIDLNHFLVLLVVTQQILQISLRLVITLLFLQIEQSAQLTHLGPICRGIAAHYFLDLLDQMQRLPSHLASLVVTLIFHWSQHWIAH